MPLTNTSTPKPQNYFVVLYHGHQLLDSAGPIDILSTIAKTEQGENFTLTYIAEDLNKVNLAAIPSRGADWVFEEVPDLPKRGDKPDKRGGSGFNPKHYADVTFADALTSLRECGQVEVENDYGERELRTLDVLFVPGGIGSRMYRVDKTTGGRGLNVQSAVDFAKAVCDEGYVRSAVMTVCTGSDLFAWTGLLDGRRATTNVAAFDKVAARHQGPRWLKNRRWVRSLPEEGEGRGKPGFGREIWTSAGISAGMDLALWFVAEVYGMDFARAIARKLEYEWRDGVGEGEVDPYYVTGSD